MGAIITQKQNNKPWTLTWKASGRYPIVADRIYATLADAQAYVDDLSATASAIPGLVLSVVNDGKNNGIYFVQSIAQDAETPGVLIKAGTGEKISALTYADALLLATEDNLGNVIFVSGDSDEGKSGLYLVSEIGKIERLGTTTATGDIPGDVNTLKALVGDEKSGLVKDVKDLQAAVGSIEIPVKGVTVDGVSVVDESGIAVIELPKVDFTDVNNAIDGKVDKADGYRLMSDAEGTKLANIAEGAQVNVIEKVIFNGQEVVVDAQTKSITLNTPADVVRGLADGEKFLSLNSETGKLGATVGLTYYTDTTGETPVYEIRLTGKDGSVVSSIDAKGFVKDGMLDSVELIENPADQAAGTYLAFTWNTESGLSEPMYVPVTDLVDVYTSGDGIDITGKVIKAKIKTDDPYIEVTTEGIASKGIDDAILLAKNAVIGTSEDKESDLTLIGVKKYAANLVSVHEGVVTAALNNKADKGAFDTFVSNTNAALGAIKIKDISSVESAGVKLVKSEEGVVSVNVNADTLTATLIGAPGEIGSVSGASIKLGQAITDGAEEDPKEIISATTSVQAAIQTLAGQIQAAVAGGITAISGGEYITVGGTATSKTLTLDTAKIGKYLVDNTSALKVDAETGKLYLQWEEI